MKEIEKVMQEDKLYRNAELSMDLLTRKLHAKRHYIATAINRCTNKSFNTFVNEYRIKEAIQILSKNSTGAFTIDAIAFDVGFNNRINFYRVFKIMTGLSPTEFRKNVVSG
jgi:YesN/AraC family two-component response regulator